MLYCASAFARRPASEIARTSISESSARHVNVFALAIAVTVDVVAHVDAIGAQQRGRIAQQPAHVERVRRKQSVANAATAEQSLNNDQTQ